MSTHRFAEVGVVLFDLDGTLIDSAPDMKDMVLAFFSSVMRPRLTREA